MVLNSRYKSKKIATMRKRISEFIIDESSIKTGTTYRYVDLGCNKLSVKTSREILTILQKYQKTEHAHWWRTIYCTIHK